MQWRKTSWAGIMIVQREGRVAQDKKKTVTTTTNLEKVSLRVISKEESTFGN